MSRHLNGTPQPVDPVWYRQMDYLHLGWAYEHWTALQIGLLTRRNGLAADTKLYQVIVRIRCHRCGARQSVVDVKPRPQQLQIVNNLATYTILSSPVALSAIAGTGEIMATQPQRIHRQHTLGTRIA